MTYNIHSISAIGGKKFIFISYMKHPITCSAHNNISMTKKFTSMLHIAAIEEVAHDCRAHLIARGRKLLDTLNAKAKFCAKWHKAVVATLTTTSQAMVIPHNHASHTEFCHEAATHKLLEALRTELFVKVRNDKYVDTLTLKEQGTLLNRSEQAHTLSTSHSNARVRLEAYNNTQCI